MDLLSLLKDIISMVTIANAVTDQKNTSMTEEYQEVLEKILRSSES